MSVARQRFKDLANRFVTNTFDDFTQTFVIESLTETADGQGGFTSSWTPFATVTGFVKPASSGEKLEDGRIKSIYDRMFMFEYIAGVENDMRIVYDGKNYNIRKILPVMDVDVWISAMADEEVAT